MRTLIIAPDTLAESVMTQPLAALLRGMDPDGRIDVLADPAVASVFEAMADIFCPTAWAVSPPTFASTSSKTNTGTAS